MRLFRRLFFFLFLLISFHAMAQPAVTPEGVKQPRILILLDASSSMLNPWGKDLTRFTAASKMVTALMDSIYRVNNQVEFGLRLYGHQSPAQNNDCFDSRQEVMFSKNNITQMALRLASVKPLGVSPIAYSLQEAANNDLLDELHNAYSIILITDGGESCGGDICNVVQTLISKKIYFKPYILSMVDYAPLKTQYTCLGTFLQVSKENEVGPALSSIVTAYRPQLIMPIMVPTKPVTSTPKKDPVPAIDIPVWNPEKSTVNYISILSNKSMWTPFHYNPLMRRMRVPTVAAPKVTRDPDVVVVPKKDTPKVVASPPKPVVKPKRDTVGASIMITTLPPVKVEPKVEKPVPEKPKVAEFVSSTEDAQETTVQIFFTDGHGHFYKTSPQLELLDAATGSSIKKFYRTTDATGSPDPLSLPSGVFDIVLPGKNRSMMKHVAIVEHKKNKIVVRVNNGSLKFVYGDAPNRPVKEFDALVSIRFEPGPTIRQHCTAELEYAPGNYYIELNTQPIRRINTDIDFGNETVITLQQPGFLQIANTEPLGNVSLYHPLGDKYAKFYELDVKGNVAAQKLQLSPGTYEAHWVKDPSIPFASETTLRFQVKPNAITTLELH